MHAFLRTLTWNERRRKLTDLARCWRRLESSTLSSRSKTHKRLKERFLIGGNRTKRANFRGSPLFQARYNIKTEKQTINSAYLVSVRCGRLAEGKGLVFSKPSLVHVCNSSFFFGLLTCHLKRTLETLQIVFRKQWLSHFPAETHEQLFQC